jgi:hypothetical protein
MDLRPLVQGYIANFGISLEVFEFFCLELFFPFLKKIGFLGLFLVQQDMGETTLPDGLETSGQRVYR